MTNQFNIYHAAKQPWLFIGKNRVMNIILRIKSGVAENVHCLHSDPSDTYKKSTGENIPNIASDSMDLYCSYNNDDYYILKKPMKTHKLRYHFQVMVNGNTLIYDETGVLPEKNERLIRPFFINYVFESTIYNTPAWTADTVWYQVFPDRFCKGDTKLSSDNFDRWSYTPVTDKDVKYGGNFQGIIKKIPYLKELGISGIYLNPIFQAFSNHKYDTIDYYQIDANFGTEAEFIALCDTCHQHDIKVMLDGVFNHCSHMTPQFQDVLEKGRLSAYYHWFIIYHESKLSQNTPINDSCESFKTEPIYETFAFVPSMPKWNTENQKVMDYLIGAAEYWTKLCNIDAWRLDVPDEISPDFLRSFRKRIKAVNPDNYIIGEIWNNDNYWLQGDMFDGVMNYTLYFIVRDFAANCLIDAYVFADRIMQYIINYPDEVQRGMFNFCGNHDIPRILTVCNGNRERALLCYLITSAMSGSLSIYYGDEVPLDGGFDPDNRRCIPWDDILIWDPEYTDSIRKMITYKKRGSEDRLSFIRALDSNTVKMEIRGEKKISLYITRSEMGKSIRLNSDNLCGSFGNGTIKERDLLLPPFGYAFILED